MAKVVLLLALVYLIAYRTTALVVRRHRRTALSQPMPSTITDKPLCGPAALDDHRHPLPVS
jgi:hypothetical protein